MSFNTEDRDSLVCNTDAISIRRRSINGDAVDCKSAAFGHDWFDPSILHHLPVVILIFIGRVNRCITRYTIGIYDKDTAKVRDAN